MRHGAQRPASQPASQRAYVPLAQHPPQHPLPVGLTGVIATRRSPTLDLDFDLEVDRTNRPGVSITLAIDLFSNHRDYLRPGGELVLDCHVNKSGRSIGFMECHIRDRETQAMVAHCRYVVSNSGLTAWLKLGAIGGPSFHGRGPFATFKRCGQYCPPAGVSGSTSMRTTPVALKGAPRDVDAAARGPRGAHESSCRHIKFLPMGWWWDLLFSPQLIPVTLALVKLFAFADSVNKL